jgi:hypothetical protein
MKIIKTPAPTPISTPFQSGSPSILRQAQDERSEDGVKKNGALISPTKITIKILLMQR